MKNYVAVVLTLVLLLSPIAVYAAGELSLTTSSKSVKRGSDMTLSGNIPGERGEVSIKVVRPDGTMFFFDVAEAEGGRYSFIIEIPSDDKQAPYGTYTAIAGYGSEQATASFMVSTGAQNPSPQVPSPPAGEEEQQVVNGTIKPEKNNAGLYEILPSAISEAIKQQADRVTIELPTSSEEGVQVELERASWTELTNANTSLTILLGKSEIRIPAGAMPIGGDSIRFTVSTKWNGDLQNRVQQALDVQGEFKASRLAISVVIEQVNGEAVTAIHSLNAPVEVSFNLSNVELQQLNQNLAGIYYVNGEQLEYVKVQFNGNQATFQTDHFSDYALLEYDKQFGDLTGHWANDAVRTLAAKQIVTGVNELEYQPAAPIKRADFVTLVMRALMWATGEEPEAEAQQFTDVKAGLYYTKHVEAAAELGIITGYNGQFRPAESITREEATAVLVRAAKHFNVMKSVEAAMPFTDQQDITSWATSFIEEAWALGLVQGNGNKLLPQQSLTRAEVAVMIDRLLTNSQTN